MTPEELRRLPLPARLKAIRGARTQKVFAAELGIEREVYNQIERGKRGIGETMAARFATATGLPADLFLSQQAQAQQLAEITRRLDAISQALGLEASNGDAPT